MDFFFEKVYHKKLITTVEFRMNEQKSKNISM